MANQYAEKEAMENAKLLAQAEALEQQTQMLNLKKSAIEAEIKAIAAQMEALSSNNQGQ